MKKEQALMVAGINTPSQQNPLGIGELDPRSLSSMPLAQYYSLAGSFVNVQNAVYYDAAFYEAGTAITPQHVAKLFTRGKSQASSVVNTGTELILFDTGFGASYHGFPAWMLLAIAGGVFVSGIRDLAASARRAGLSPCACRSPRPAKIAARKACFSSFVLVPSTTLMSSQKLALP